MADLLAEVDSDGIHGCATLKKQAEFAKVWREFGLDRVLFGSDVGFGPSGYTNATTVAKARVGLLSNPFLTPEEKEQILTGNFEKLIPHSNK
jgi:predicted TIM-barrel fold metal-dependent hydrolase